MSEPLGPNGPLDELERQAAEDGLAAIAATGVVEPFDPDEPATDPDEAVPGSGAEPTISLDEVEKEELAHILCRQLDEHDQAIEPRRKRLDRIMQNYNMVVDEARTGLHPFSARLCSELTKSSCDQATARLSAMVLDTGHLVQIKPADDEEEDEEVLAEAKAAEQFMDVYSEREIDVKSKLPLQIQTAVQVGDGITYDMWEEEIDRVYFFDDNGDLDYTDVKYGGISLRHIHYRDFYLWPLGLDDWQKEYQFVGHDGPELTAAAYAAQLTEWGFDSAEIEELTVGGSEPDEGKEVLRKGDDVDTSAWSDGVFQITEIWYQGAIGPLPADKYKMFIDRKRRKILRVGPNPIHCREHPYRPIRYKRRFNFSYSEGVGEELLQAQAIASTLDNQEIDNAKVVGNHAMFYDENKAPQGFFQDVYPGVRQGVDGNPKDVVMMTPLGGPVEALKDARATNDFRAMRATGLPPVLTGSGDPTLKSGADASSIMALISEAGRKFGHIDRTMKNDIAAKVEFWFELLAQYAPNGFYSDHITPRRALPLEARKYKPPRGRIKGKFRVEVTAPSPSSNREVQKQHIMVLNQMADNYLVFIERVGMEVYAAEGQQEQLLDLKRQIFTFKTMLWQELLQLHEIPGLVPQIPKLEQPTPDEQKIDELRTRLVQATQQLDQMGAQLAVYDRAGQLMAQGQDPQSALNTAQNELAQQQAQTEPEPGLPPGQPIQ